MRCNPADPCHELQDKRSCCCGGRHFGVILEAREASLNLGARCTSAPGPLPPPLTFGNIDFVGRQDVRLNAIYFHVQVLGIALRTGARGTCWGPRAVWTWKWGRGGGMLRALALTGKAGKGTEPRRGVGRSPSPGGPSSCRPPGAACAGGVARGRGAVEAAPSVGAQALGAGTLTRKSW